MGKELESYSDLYQFLCSLRDSLTAHGQKEASDQINRASRFYGGSPTEFLDESRIALLAVRKYAKKHLSDDQVNAIDGVVAQINASFRAIGSE
jgi:hypothetical protein